MKTTPWIILDGYCAMRCIEGTEFSIANRVAFIEKTPRVRRNPYTQKDDWENWESGPKGSSGYTDNHEQEGNYGFDRDSRKWCDEELIKMGYVLG